MGIVNRDSRLRSLKRKEWRLRRECLHASLLSFLMSSLSASSVRFPSRRCTRTSVLLSIPLEALELGFKREILSSSLALPKEPQYFWSPLFRSSYLSKLTNASSPSLNSKSFDVITNTLYTAFPRRNSRTIAKGLMLNPPLEAPPALRTVFEGMGAFD